LCEDFNEDVCNARLLRREKRKSEGGSSNSNKRLQTGKSNELLKFSGKGHDWLTQKDKFVAQLSSMINEDGVPLEYVIRDEADVLEKRVDDLPAYQRKIYTAPLEGKTFQADNYNVYQQLVQWTRDGSAMAFVQGHAETHDGRGAFLEMKSNFEGQDHKTTMIKQAQRIVRQAHFKDNTPRYTIEDYCTRHIRANNIFKQYGEEHSGLAQVRDFLENIDEKHMSIKIFILGDEELKTNLHKATLKFKALYYAANTKRLNNADDNIAISNNNSGRRNIGAATATIGGNNPTGKSIFKGNGKYTKNNNKNNKNNNKNGDTPRDNLFIPSEIMDKLNKAQQAMILRGRDSMRQENAKRGDRPQQRQAAAVVTNNNSNNNTSDNNDNNNSDNVNGDNSTQLVTFRDRSLGPRNQGSLKSTERRTAGATITTPAYQESTDYNALSRADIDTRADTVCAGKAFRLYDQTDRVCDVGGYHESLPSLKNVPIGTAATAYDHADGNTYILAFHEALYFGDSMATSLIPPAQLQANGMVVDTCLKQFSNGRSLHGIYMPLEDITIPFQNSGIISYLPIRLPTDRDMDDCKWLWMTSDAPWEPYGNFYTEREQTYRRIHDNNNDGANFRNNTYLHDGERLTAATSSRDHRANVTSAELARRWGTSDAVAATALKVTTQRGFRQLLSPLQRRFRTRQAHLALPFLKTTVYSDTLFHDLKSIRGNNCGQIFVSTDEFGAFYPLRSKADAFDALNSFVKEFGVMDKLVTDNAGEQLGENWEQVRKKYLIKQTTTEPYSPWQNKAEAEIRELKKHARRIMHRARVPERLWDFAYEYAAGLRNMLPRWSLDNRTPYEVMTGTTPDASEYVNFAFYDWVYFHDSQAHNKRTLARWLGPARNVGQAMCYYVLKDNGRVMVRSSVTPLTKDEHLDKVEDKRRDEFDKDLAVFVGDHDTMAVMETEADEMMDPSPEESGDLEVEALNEEVTSYATPNDMLFINAEVMLSNGDRMEMAKVIGRKRDNDGNYVGRRHTNPILDSRLFTVEFNSGEQKDIAYNILAEQLLSTTDSEGRQYQLFREIIGHRKSDKAVERSDMHRVDKRNGRRYMKKTTAGWELEVEWKDGSTSWLPLKDLKETNTIETAQYASNNNIIDEPAFTWWAPVALKKAQRLIKLSKKMQVRQGYKFGIKVPRSIKEALMLDADNKNTLWQDAIIKEMTNVKVAFKSIGKDIKPPPGYTRIPTQMIFDLKMDFTRKARLVAGGHVTDAPTTITYSSVVSRDSVRICFLIAALNDLDIWMSDVGNAYLNAQPREKVYTIAGVEFGEEEGHTMLIVRALYGLKSSGAAWRSHFANSLRDLGFLSNQADPDVWTREAVKTQGDKYYEYVLVYVDDQLTISEDPKNITDSLQQEPFNYTLKDVGPPKRYLGATVGTCVDIGEKAWYLSADDYLDKALPTVEERFGSLKTMFSKSRVDSPLPHDYHPEIDESEFLDDDSKQLYQSYVGILRWAVELARIDLAHACGVLAKYMAAPRQGHLTAIIRVFAYIKKHNRSKIIIDKYERDFKDIDWKDTDWREFYPTIEPEVTPYNALPIRGKEVQINMYCDASHATDLVTRRSTTGILFFINGTPIKWYSKRQNTIESSTFGSEFVALRIAVEMNDALRYKLRMFGVGIKGPTNGFCDNMSVVKNATIPESTLAKKHNSIAYHKVRECVAAGSIRIAHEPGKSNPADVLTKSLNGIAHVTCCKSFMYR
jgi:hypothetical protein